MYKNSVERLNSVNSLMKRLTVTIPSVLLIAIYAMDGGLVHLAHQGCHRQVHQPERTCGHSHGPVKPPLGEDAVLGQLSLEATDCLACSYLAGRVFLTTSTAPKYARQASGSMTSTKWPNYELALRPRQQARAPPLPVG